MITTEHSDQHYFGMYVTCEHAGFKNKWFSMLQIGVDSVLKIWSSRLGVTCGIRIPEWILKSIKVDYEDACRKTGKVIVAKINDSDGKLVRELYGVAIAEPVFESEVRYCMPDEMQNKIRVYSSDKKVHSYGNGIDDGPCVEDLSVYAGRRRKLFFDRFVQNDPFADPESRDNGEMKRFELTLEVVEPIQ